MLSPRSRSLTFNGKRRFSTENLHFVHAKRHFVPLLTNLDPFVLYFGCEVMKMFKKKKEQRRKPKYGMFSSVGYIYRLLWEHERFLVFVGLAVVPLSHCTRPRRSSTRSAVRTTSAGSPS